MSLQEDFSQSDLDVKGYIRCIWTETELEGDNFSELDYFDDFETLKPILVDLIENKMAGITPFRKNMYRAFLAKLENTQEQRDAFDQWLRELNAYIDLDNEKRDYIAKYMTRILRGDLCNIHRTPQEALTILKAHRASVWDQYKLQLENLCTSMGVN